MNEITVSKESSVLKPNTRTFEERQEELRLLDKKAENDLKNAKRSPFNNWLQLNRDHNKELMALSKQDPNAMCVLLFLLDNMDNYNCVTCSYKVLEGACELSNSSITRAIKTLKTCKFLDIVKLGTMNSYSINKEIAWTSYGTNYKYGKFSSNILIDTSQIGEVKKEKKQVLKSKKK